QWGDGGDLLPRSVLGSVELVAALQIALDRILCHLGNIRVTVQCGDIALAALDGLKRVNYAPRRVAAHSATASASADAETGRLSSWTGNTSMSSPPNSARVSSIRPDARISRFPSAGSISTRMSMSDPAFAVPRATDPISFGLVAQYRSKS